ncbi:MAG: SpoIIE family protein phosphatase [Leptospiraceae bacterium]|nr:SpoIIE family protein phosphatase [Leptospiraceae bacterium]
MIARPESCFPEIFFFGGLEDSWKFYADENYFQCIEGFHMAYMPSRDILNYALRKIEDLDIELIAPQHGSIIKKQYIRPLIEQMKQMDCGLYIDKKYSKDLLRTIEKLNNLQQEFELSLAEIKDLKRKQDGDYFLTSLLMQPLFTVGHEDTTVRTDSVVIQKKSFLFKEKHYLLGGDICITGNLNFNGQAYTLFFNGDAMGKSIQGAGGAVVIGTVLNSMIARTRDVVLKIDPGEWLEAAYQEIQTVFLSFDGAMMVSGILGLINDDSGETLFLNAEHPFMVLYRNGTASFVEEELTLRKFGCPSEFELQIQKIQLQPGDVLISGSDGKDDINLTPGSGPADINADATLFLRLVERCSGNLRGIVRQVFQAGEVTDDLSLLRVAYRETPEQKRQVHTIPDSMIYEIQINNHIRNKNYEKALALMEGPSEKQTPEILFYRGYCLVREKRYLKALKYLTLAIKQRPDFFQALKYAGFAHYGIGNITRCAEYWSQALEINPEDDYLRRNYDRLGDRLERRKVLLGRKQMEH